ncbi:hypothetical protein C8R41DRAFT_836798 [Lentinula lateritia]|uniref:Sm protein B n=1 Tax=Lentinula lateritia TaxID=40482 RepID=A0ABQ8VCQ4_9AGAR|nr:hypothetical protein C8R41DRAFT_836798 [Lentinula lateritia]
MPPPKSKGGKMLGLINWRLKVTINDGRALTGQMLAFDKHMNLVLAECEEFRRVRPKKKAGDESAPAEQELKRTLGLVILRGETVVSLSVEGPPPVVDDDKKNTLPVGPGRGMPAGRGMGMMPPSALSNCSIFSFRFDVDSFQWVLHPWLLRCHFRQECQVRHLASVRLVSRLVCLLLQHQGLLDLLLASNHPLNKKQTKNYTVVFHALVALSCSILHLK